MLTPTNFFHPLIFHRPFSHPFQSILHLTPNYPLIVIESVLFMFLNCCAKSLKVKYIYYSLRMSLRTVLLPAPMPPPMRSKTGLRSQWATGTITSLLESPLLLLPPITFISSTKVENTRVTFKFFVTLSNLCFLSHQQNKTRNLTYLVNTFFDL